MRTILPVLILALVACSDKKADKCEAARDRVLGWQAELSKAAIGAEPPERRAELEKEAETEMAQFKAKFVDACKKAKGLDMTCFDSKEKGKDPACKTALEPLWKEIYGK